MLMWELRLILVLIGVVIVAGVYLLSRHNRGSFSRREPRLDDTGLPEPVLSDAAPPLPAGSKTTQLILALHVSAPVDSPFEGTAVQAALKAAELSFGEYQVFHRLTRSAPPRSVFSVANMLKPGELDPDTLAKGPLQGLTLFLVLPGPQAGVDAYADMLATARRLADQLGGEVLDETRSTLSRQTAHHIRERIIEFERRAGLPQSQ